MKKLTIAMIVFMFYFVPTPPQPLNAAGEELPDYKNTGIENVGNHNTGSFNVGNRNTGDSNVGNYNSGFKNVGDFNAGDFNVADRATGFFCTVPGQVIIFDELAIVEDMTKLQPRLDALQWVLESDTPCPFYAWFLDIPNATLPKIIKLHKLHMARRAGSASE